VAYVVGDVEIGENSGVWPGTVIRGDFGSIRIGKNCQIQDNSVVHSGTIVVEIGDNVIIGHSAVEATGDLEMSLVAALQADRLPVVVTNPRQVHDFARAIGILSFPPTCV